MLIFMSHTVKQKHSLPAMPFLFLHPALIVFVCLCLWVGGCNYFCVHPPRYICSRSKKSHEANKQKNMTCSVWPWDKTPWPWPWQTWEGIQDDGGPLVALNGLVLVYSNILVSLFLSPPISLPLTGVWMCTIARRSARKRTGLNIRRSARSCVWWPSTG